MLADTHNKKAVKYLTVCVACSLVWQTDWGSDTVAPSSAAGLYPVVKLFESEDIVGILGVSIC